MSNLSKSKFFLGVLALVLGVAVASSAFAADGALTKTLKKGMKDVQVKYLQQILNEKGFTVASSGAGSAGKETTSFGPATVAAVKAFQKANALTADGIVGAKSRALLNGGTTTTTTTGTTTTTTVSGPLSVALASDNPAAAYVIANQASADLAHFTLSGTGTLNSVVLKRIGVSDQNTLSNVYLYDGATRLTDGYSFNNVGELTMNGLGIMVNGSKTLSVKADVADVSNASTIGVSLIGYTVAGSSATSASIAGNLMTYGKGGLASAYLDASNSVSASNVDAGTSNFTVWSDTVQVNTRAILLKGANFRMVGSAPYDALSNIKLYVDGVSVGTATLGSITGTNYAMFNLSGSPVSLSTGSHTVEVRADVVKGANYDVTLSVQQASDLVLYDPQVGVNIAVAQSSSVAFTSNSAGKISIKAGSASIVVDPSFTSQTTVTGGATNVVIGKFKVHGYGEDVKVTSLVVKPAVANGATSSGSTTNLNNVSVYFNGSQVGSSANYDGTNNMTFQLGSQMILPAGADSYVEVRADLQNSSSVNYTAGTVTVKLNPGSATLNNAQGQSSHNTFSFPSAEIGTTGLSVQTGTLKVAKNPAYTAQTYNPNTANVKIGSFVLQNQSSSEEVRVTSLLVGLTLTNVDLTNLSNLKTSENSSPVQPAASNTFSVDFTLAAGATKIVDVYADLSSDSSGSIVATLKATSLGKSSNVSISQNSDGNAVNGQTITLGSGSVATPTVVASSSTTAQFVPAGTTTGVTDATKATFNVVATNGNATISELKFTTATGANQTTITGIRVGSSTASMVSGVAYLTGLSLAIPNGGAGANVEAYASYAPVGATGVTSNTSDTLKLCYMKYTIGGTTTAVGSTACGGADDVNYPVSSGQAMTAVASRPTVSVAKPSGVVVAPSSSVEAIDVTVTADSSGPIKVVSIPVNVSIAGLAATTNNFTTANFVVKDKDNNTISTATGGCGSTTACTNVTLTLNSTDGYLIAAGQSQTFKIFVNTGAYTIPTTQLPNTYLYTTVGGSGTFSWLDVAGNNTTPITGTSLIYNYPSTTTISVNN